MYVLFRLLHKKCPHYLTKIALNLYVPISGFNVLLLHHDNYHNPKDYLGLVTWSSSELPRMHSSMLLLGKGATISYISPENTTGGHKPHHHSCFGIEVHQGTRQFIGEHIFFSKTQLSPVLSVSVASLFI